MKISTFVVAAMLALVPLSSVRGSASDQNEKLQNAGMVMQEVLNISEDIPRDLLDQAHCVVVMPSVLKGAFIVGGSYGRGAMVCRTGKDFQGPWGKPSMMALEGGSIGFQIGG